LSNLSSNPWVLWVFEITRNWMFFSVLGGSHFLWEPSVPVFGAGSENRPGSSSSSFFNFPFRELPRFSEFNFFFWLCDFQGQKVSHNFKPPILKGGSQKSIPINDNVIMWELVWFSDLMPSENLGGSHRRFSLRTEIKTGTVFLPAGENRPTLVLSFWIFLPKATTDFFYNFSS
jgi:hypothetical protein